MPLAEGRRICSTGQGFGLDVRNNHPGAERLRLACFGFVAHRIRRHEKCRQQVGSGLSDWSRVNQLGCSANAVHGCRARKFRFSFSFRAMAVSPQVSPHSTSEARSNGCVTMWCRFGLALLDVQLHRIRRPRQPQPLRQPRRLPPRSVQHRLPMSHRQLKYADSMCGVERFERARQTFCRCHRSPQRRRPRR